MTDSHTIAYIYDEFQRMVQRHIYSERSGGGYWETFVYRVNSTAGKSMSEISEKRNWIDDDTRSHYFHYTYDANGNILTETDSENNTSVTYTYDNQNQLLTATYDDGRTETYTYDTAGNLLTFNNGITSHTYTYSNEDWRDLLTAVDGVTLTYDEIGNPLNYHNGSTYTMTWAEGRRLESVTSGEDTTAYEYDYNGYRTKKINPDGSYIEYYVVDGRTVGEVQYEEDGTPELYVRYTYDENGSIIGFSLWYEGGTSWTVYYFLKNLQGDVIQIYKASDNTVVAEYTYDSWGNVLSATGELAELNPFRYRGYYYDEETGFYYVFSRYYDSELGRFVSADNQIAGVGGDINDFNLYSYCGNNSVNRIDPDGHAWKNVKNWFSNACNKAKTTAKKVVQNVKNKLTKKHYKERIKKNGEHPIYDQVVSSSSWTKVSEDQTKYHDNRIGEPELKFTNNDGREAVFDGDTLQPVTDHRYIATYNFCPVQQLPDNPEIKDYFTYGATMAAHAWQDVIPYYIWGNSPEDTTTFMDRILLSF